MMGQLNYEDAQKAYYKSAPIDSGLAIPLFTYKDLTKIGFIKDVTKYGNNRN